MAICDRLLLWIDAESRPGPEAMAVDEWLLETARLTVLRVYAWRGDWVSLGYFGKIAEAREAFAGVDCVRRSTGGGLVDHRADWTYSLIIPADRHPYRQRGAESYRLIHEALAKALTAEGVEARLCDGGHETGHGLCFRNPVWHDLIAHDGRKLAGAGQRRNKSGLLHQGSLALPCAGVRNILRAERLAAELAHAWERVEQKPPVAEIARKINERYASVMWTHRC